MSDEFKPASVGSFGEKVDSLIDRSAADVAARDAPEPAPVEHDPMLMKMHAVLDELLGMAGHLASLVPTASGAVAQLAALRAKHAEALDPPK